MSDREPKREASARDVLREFDVDERTLRRWIRRGCPVTRGRPGTPHRYSVLEVAAWLRAQGLTTVAGPQADPIEMGATPEQQQEMAELKKRRLSLEVRKLEAAVAKVEERQVDRADVERANVQRALAFRASLLGLPTRLAPILTPLEDAVDIEIALRDALEEVLEELAARPVVVVAGEGGA